MSDVATPAPASRVDFAAALKDAGWTAVITTAILFPFLGLLTIQNMESQLALISRWPLFLSFLAITVVGRFLLTVFVWSRPAKAKKAPFALSPKVERTAAPFFLGLLFAFPLVILATLGAGGSIKWIDNFGIQILIYIMLGWGLNVVVGLAGLLDLGYVAFYAVGAYSYALLSEQFGFSFWLLLPMAGILAATWGVILGFPVDRKSVV
jgi:branched-chain amino acid transport system permease protein